MKLNELLNKTKQDAKNKLYGTQTSTSTPQVDVVTSAAPTVSSAQKSTSSAATGATAGVAGMVNNAPATAVSTSTTGTPVTKTTTSSGTGTTTTDDTKSTYMDQLSSLYDQIVNRGSFSYDLNGDMLYRQMADQYTELGRQAMRDSTGVAAALTGGYGNSYANLVGNQAYQSYLTQLNDNIPELYELAYEAWQDEGDELESKYDATLAHIGNLKEYAPTTSGGSGSSNKKDEEEDENANGNTSGSLWDELWSTAQTAENYTPYYYALLDELTKKK